MKHLTIGTLDSLEYIIIGFGIISILFFLMAFILTVILLVNILKTPDFDFERDIKHPNPPKCPTKKILRDTNTYLDQS